MKIRILLVTAFLLVNVSTFADGGNSTAPKAVKQVPDDIIKLIEQQRFEIAASKLTKFVKREKKNADAWNYLGYSQRKIGQLDASLNAYQKALGIDGEHLGANEYLGELYLMMQQPEKAQKQLEKLARICGDCSQYKKLNEAIATY